MNHLLLASLAAPGRWALQRRPPDGPRAWSSTASSALRTLLALAAALALGLGLHSPASASVPGDPLLRPPALAAAAPAAAGAPDGMRGWQAVPGVIRADGLDSFRLEVETDGPVAGVTVERLFTAELVPPQPPPFALRDDGEGGDRVAGDFVFTSGPFRFNTDTAFRCLQSAGLPPGLAIDSIGDVQIHDLDGSVFPWTEVPKIGFLCGAETTPSTVLSPDVAVSPHLVNVRTDALGGASFLRFRDPGVLFGATKRLYRALPDAFDVLMLFATGHVERIDRQRNLVAGSHWQVKTNFTGTGAPQVDDSAAFGSAGRLLGINALGAYRVGLSSRVVTHEMLHQWGAYLDTGLGLSNGAHYDNNTSVGSLLGGFQWIDNGDGTFTNEPDAEGPNGAHHAAPLDLYLMGLIDASAVPALHRDLDRSAEDIGPRPYVIERFATVTIADIQARHGVRSPGPEDAQRDFRLGFVAESQGRLLNPTEMTFYETLAREYTAPIPAGAPDPFVGNDWVSISRFFRGLATFRSDVPMPDVRADLALAANARDEVALGRNFQLRAVARNLGPGPARNVVVDLIGPPDEVNLVAIDCAGGARSDRHPAACVFPGLEAGESVAVRFILNACCPPARGRAIENRLTVSADTSDPNPRNNEARVLTEVTLPAAPADLALAANARDEVALGRNFQLRAVARNLGPGPARNVVVDLIGPPDEVNLVAIDCAGGARSDRHPAACVFPGLEAGESVAVRFILNACCPPARGRAIENRLTVSADTSDPNPRNNEARVLTEVTLPAAPADLALAANARDEVALGRNFQLRAVARNLGPGPARNVVVDLIGPPDEVNLVAIDCAGGARSDRHPAACVFPGLEAGESVAVRFILNACCPPARGRAIENRLTVSADTSDPNRPNNRASVTTRVRRP